MRWLARRAFSRNSIRFKLAIGVIVTAVPLLALLYFYNFYAAWVVQNQVESSNTNMMSLYMNQLDAGLEAVDQYILNAISSNYDVKVMNDPRSEEEFVLALVKVSNQFDKDALMYRSFVNSIFVYSPDRDAIAATLSQVSSSEYMALNRYIRSSLLTSFEESDVPLHWFVRQIGSEYYLFRVQPMGRLWLGAWVNVRTLQQPLSLIDLGQDGASLFLTVDGVPMTNEAFIRERKIELKPIDQHAYQTGPNGRYHVITQASTKGDFGLSAVVSDDSILQYLPYLNRIVIILTVIGALMIPFFFLYLRKTVLTPLNKIIQATKRIREGSLHTRIEPFHTSDEFLMVNRNFNEMIDQIESLKISVYEEQLNKQKAELQNLQSQINPHFFLNTLNLIYSLALDRDYELIKEMTMRLIRHFRFMFRSNLTFVPLREELEHVRNYLAIHEMRFQQTFDCRIEVPEELMKAMVPPLVIQTFVENALKHGSSIERPLKLNVTIRQDGAETDSGMIIVIEDAGEGFPEHQLPLLNAGERIEDEQGEHIGAWNVWHRLRLLYGDRSYIRFSNVEAGGARVMIRLPFHEQAR